MDLVLGLSVTSTAVRWVLVEGVTGDGDAVDRGALDIIDVSTFDAEALFTVLLDANEAVLESGVHAVGVTWTPGADVAAGAILDALAARDLANVISISEIEAAGALAGGIADIAGYDDVAVCVFEPGATLVAVATADGVTVDPQPLPADGDAELAGSVIALDLNDRMLDAVFVVGSADLDRVVAAMDTVAAAPVISSAEADMAMARGAAVAAAAAVNAMDTSAAPLSRLRRMSTTGVLTSVVVAAAVTLVVSLSVALGLRATDDSPSETKNASATGEQLREEAVQSEAKAQQALPKLQQRPAAAPKPQPAALPPAPVPAAPPVVETMVAVPPAPAAEPPASHIPDAWVPPAAAPPAPVYVPPAPAYTPPAPAYVPPAPAPAYVPPAPQVPAVQPQPRLRDRIIERIPIFNRFHEPQYMYPTP